MSEGFVSGLIVTEVTQVIVRVITMFETYVFSQESFVFGLIFTELTTVIVSHYHDSRSCVSQEGFVSGIIVAELTTVIV